MGIALSCGFMSSQSFSAAFKKYHHITPKQYQQKQGCQGMVVLDPEVIAKFEVTIQFIPQFTIAYERSFGEYDNATLDNKRNTMLLQYQEKKYIGVAWDNPAVTPKENCRFDYGYIVEKDIKGETLPTQDIPSKTYAILSLLKKDIDTKNVWEYLYVNWLPRHGYKPDALFCFEKIEQPNTDTIHLYLPIIKI